MTKKSTKGTLALSESKAKNLPEKQGTVQGHRDGFGFVITTNEKLPFQSRSNAVQLEDFKTIPVLRKRIIDPEFRLLVNRIESRCGYYLYVMQTAKDLNTKLLSQLNKKEF